MPIKVFSALVETCFHQRKPTVLPVRLFFPLLEPLRVVVRGQLVLLLEETSFEKVQTDALPLVETFSPLVETHSFGCKNCFPCNGKIFPIRGNTQFFQQQKCISASKHIFSSRLPLVGIHIFACKNWFSQLWKHISNYWKHKFFPLKTIFPLVGTYFPLLKNLIVVEGL